MPYARLPPGQRLLAANYRGFIHCAAEMATGNKRERAIARSRLNAYVEGLLSALADTIGMPRDSSQPLDEFDE